MVSHSYHALQSCCNEPIFSGYYPKNYVFSKPNYFYEETEDFKPFDGNPKARDSPKRFNQDYRYKPMNYPNFVMDRRPGSKSQNSVMMNDGNSPPNYNRTIKKGSYNFHRFWNSGPQSATKSDQAENFRGVEYAKLQNTDDSKKDDTKGDNNENERRSERKCNNNEFGRDQLVENVWNIENVNKEDNNKIADDVKRTEKMKVQERQELQGHAKKDENQKQNDKPFSSKKKAKAEAMASKEPTDVDDDGFTKVKYRSHGGSKKQKNSEHNNESVNWIVPSRENKEQK